jgi:hypothetical protein
MTMTRISTVAGFLVLIVMAGTAVATYESTTPYLGSVVTASN